MTIYKLPSGSYKVDIRRTRRGEKPYRDSATLVTKAEAEAYQTATLRTLRKARDAGLEVPEKTTLYDLLDDWWLDHERKVAESNRQAVHRRMKMWQRSHLS